MPGCKPELYLKDGHNCIGCQVSKFPYKSEEKNNDLPFTNLNQEKVLRGRSPALKFSNVNT